MASGTTPTYLIPYPLSSDPVNVHGDLQTLALQLEDILYLKPDKQKANIFTKSNAFNLTGTDTVTILQSGTAVPLTITNTGTGNSFVVEDAASTDSTPFVIDASGNVAIGKTTASVKLDVVGAGTFSGALIASTFNGLTNTANATGFTIAGGTTSVGVTFAGGTAYTISGTNGQTYTMPSTGGTLSLNPMTTLGDIIYGGASGVPTRLAGNTTNGIYFLRSNVTASASVAPDWIGSTGTVNVVLSTSPTITTPKIDSLNTVAGAAATPTLWSDVTTGTIAIGAGLTTGIVNIATAGTGANFVNIGNVNSTLTVNGNLVVNGTTNTLNTNTLTVDDKNIELGSVAAATISTTGTIGTVSGAGPFTATITGMSSTVGLIPGQIITATAGTGSFGSGVMSVVSIVSATSINVSSTLTFTAGTVTNILGQAATDATANGGGITLKGATDKTITWDSTNSNWTSSENWNIASGKTFKINNTSVLSSTVVLGLTPTINATGFKLSGGTTAKYVQINNDIILAGTDGSTLNIGGGGTLGSAAFTASTAYEPAITTLAISKGGTNISTYTTGDLLYASATNTLAKLPISTNGYVLTLVSGLPAWAANTGLVNPMTTLGDMIYGGASGAATRLAGATVNGTYLLTATVTASAAVAPTWTVATGSGSPVFGTSPTITTPTIDVINAASATGTTQTLFGNTTSGTINIGGSAFTTGIINIGTAGSSTNSINLGNTNTTVTVNGNLTVNGTTTTVNSVTITVDDPNIELNSVASPSDANAAGGGITVKATNDKSIVWQSTATTGNTTNTGYWNLTDNLNLNGSTKSYYINGTAVLSSTAVLGITHTINATGFSLAGGTTSKTLTVSNTLTLAGTDSSTLNIGGGGTLGSAAFTASSAYEPTITTLTIAKGGTGTGTAPTQWGIIYAASATAYASTGAGTNGQVLQANTGNAPTWVDPSTLGITAAAGTLTGTTLASNVTASSLTSVGTLTSLTVSGTSTFNSLSIPGTATFLSTVTVPTPVNNTDATNKAYVDSVLAAGIPEIVPLDDLSGDFDGRQTVFVPKYQGIKQTITNPLRLQLAINGIIQYVDFPDYVWQSPLPREGFQINNDGNIMFSEAVPAGSRFNATIQPGPNTITKKRQYPFKAMDILLGG